MSHRPLSSRSALVGLFASLALSACGVGAGAGTTASSRSRVSAATVDSLTSGVDQGACIAALKDQVYANTLTIEEYEARALSDCGVDFNAPADSTKTPAAPEPEPTPATPEELAYIACVTTVKGEVIAGTLDINDYEAALASRCPPPPPAAK